MKNSTKVVVGLIICVFTLLGFAVMGFLVWAILSPERPH